MKTIYFYGIDNNKGGMETYALNLIDGILKSSNEYKFHILTEYGDFAFKERFVNELKCDFTILPSSKKHPVKFKNQLRKILKNANPNDLLHLNVMSYRNVFLFNALRKLKIKTIIVGHSTNSKSLIDKLQHKISKHLFKRIGTIKVGANSKVISYSFTKNIKNTKIIPIGIDEKSFIFNDNLRTQVRQELKLNNNDFLIGHVGRISKEKNQIFSCKIMKLLQSNPKIKLVFIGKNNNKKIEKFINKNNLTNIKILGEISNVQKYYNAFDLFVFPSIFESAGLALYESLSNGCPSLASKYIPLDDLKSANLVTLDLNEKIWAEKIINNFNQEKKRKEKCNDDAIPTLDTEIKNYLDLYNKLTK